MVNALKGTDNEERIRDGVTFIYVYRSISKKVLYKIKIDASDFDWTYGITQNKKTLWSNDYCYYSVQFYIVQLHTRNILILVVVALFIGP